MAINSLRMFSAWRLKVVFTLGSDDSLVTPSTSRRTSGPNAASISSSVQDVSSTASWRSAVTTVSTSTAFRPNSEQFGSGGLHRGRHCGVLGRDENRWPSEPLCPPAETDRRVDNATYRIEPLAQRPARGLAHGAPSAITQQLAAPTEWSCFALVSQHALWKDG